MDTAGICLNCFSQRGAYDVCPYCGYVAGTVPAEGYVLHPGSRLWGRYLVGTVLGAGGFGITYRAWDTRLNTMVAIKEFFPQNLVSRIPGEVNVRVFSGEKQESYTGQLVRFIQEAKNMAKFTGDAYIVSVLDYFEDNGTAYIVMEYLDGVTLKEYMAQQGGRLPVQQAVEMASALLKALSTIHEKGIIHRDISPDNIFVLRDGSIKVLDFGAARFAEREGSDLTQGVVVKKGYAPPEQYRTNMKQGVWTDIYAAGATLYKMVTGITPEESIERTEKDVLKRPSQTGRALDASVDKTVMKAMALRPELRFKSADAMLAALENRTVIDFPEEELKKRKKRNGILGVASVLLVLVAAGLVAWRASQSPGAVVGGPALNVDAIQPDTISILTAVYPENYSNPTGDRDVLIQLADAFMEQYPQHNVVVETYDYQGGSSESYDQMMRDMTPRFFTADAPTIFDIHLPDIDQDETPYRADISRLYASLNADDFLLLTEYGKEEKEDSDGAIFDVPTGFTSYAAYVNADAAAERGMEVPGAIESWDQVLAWERDMPGTVELSPGEMARYMGPLLPELRKNKDLDELERRVLEYADLYRQGYFQLYDQAMMESGGYQYRQMMFHFSDTDPWAVRHYRQAGAYQTVPLLTNGKVECNFYDYYSVSNQATENQQQLAMLFLRFVLSEYGQNIMHVQNDTGQPLNKTALDQYVQANPELAYLTGEYSGKLAQGNSSLYLHDLRVLLDEEDAGDAAIGAYVREEYARWEE